MSAIMQSYAHVLLFIMPIMLSDEKNIKYI